MQIRKFLNPLNYIRYLKYRKRLICKEKSNRREKKLSQQYLANLEQHRKEEAKKFKKLGLNTDDALFRLNSILHQTREKKFDYTFGKDSVHWLLFSAISIADQVKQILEIGTGQGDSTLILSRLFPEASILTVDLPANDPITRSTYGRETDENFKDYVRLRSRNTEQPSVNMVCSNSFFLLDVIGNQEFDLVWVDGGHLYPEVAWDLANGFHVCRRGGWLLCDDVLIHPDGYNNGLTNTDSYEVLKYMQKRIDSQIVYFLKRENPIWSADPKKRKYVSVFRKPV